MGMEKQVNGMIERASEAAHVIIVGAGKTFFNLMCLLQKHGVYVHEVFDNNESLVGCIYNGVKVTRPHKSADGTLYIIDSKSDKVADQLKQQLLTLGVDDGMIIRQPHVKTEVVLDESDEDGLKKALDELFYERFGRYINWDAPQKYNEIINYEKVYDRDARKKQLADKYLVREYVKDKIGEKYLIKHIGCWNDPEKIDFYDLPKQFVLKTNNGSGRNIIVTDKDKLDIPGAKEKLKKWMDSDYWKGLYEFQYKDIPPVIICEEYLEEVGDEANEFKFYCFNGKCRFVGCERNSHKPGWVASIYDTDWREQEFSYALPRDTVLREKPKHLEEMIRLSEILSDGFRHVRVDLYELPKGEVLFGELTFSSWGGMKHFMPEEYDEVFGSYIKPVK